MDGLNNSSERPDFQFLLQETDSRKQSCTDTKIAEKSEKHFPNSLTRCQIADKLSPALKRGTPNLESPKH